jgi:hypothetical protein
MAIEDYGQKLEESVDYLLPEKDKVKLLSDGSLYADYLSEVDIYEGGFCIENFVDLTEPFSGILAYINVPFTPSLNLKSTNAKKVHTDRHL